MPMDCSKIVVVCPHCGSEYLPSEILMEDGLLGDVSNIVKTSQGKIVGYSGTSLNIKDEYVCDYCNKPFEVRGKLHLESFPKEEFDEESTTPLFKDRIDLPED